jgi:hypothetical protein
VGIGDEGPIARLGMGRHILTFGDALLLGKVDGEAEIQQYFWH